MCIVRNLQNDDAYLYLGENKFRNIRTGKEGIVDDEIARKVFKINVEATAIWTEYPMLEDFISALNLKFDNEKNKSK